MLVVVTVGYCNGPLGKKKSTQMARAEDFILVAREDSVTQGQKVSTVDAYV